jgi:hypothetical protein
MIILQMLVGKLGFCGLSLGDPAQLAYALGSPFMCTHTCACLCCLSA